MEGAVLRPSGMLDLEGCATLRRAMAEAMARGTRHFVLDLSSVTGLDLFGVRMLRGVRDHLDGGLVVIHPSEPVLRALRVNDLLDLLLVDDLPPAPAPAVRTAPVPARNVVPLRGRPA